MKPLVNRLTWSVIIAAMLAPCSRASAQAAAKPAYDGKVLFQQFCVICHGGRGEGGQLGPALTSAKLAAAADRDIFSTIANGNVEKGMPMFGRSLLRDEMTALVAQVRQFQQKSTERAASQPAKPSPIPPGGSAANGEKLFKGKGGCIDCHSIFFVGGVVGPDLTKVAERMGQGEIYESVAEPSKKINRDFRAKVITTKDGKKIEGLFRNETAETVQILDKTGSLWTTYFKKDVQSVENKKESLMPEGLLGKLNEAEAKDLFAFLYELK